MKFLDAPATRRHNVAPYVATRNGMRFATVRELKNRTSETLRRAAGGSDVLITSHGRPVAVLVGLKDEDLEDWVLARHAAVRDSIEAADRDPRRRSGIPLGKVIRVFKARAAGTRKRR